MPRPQTAVQTPGEPTTAAPADQPAADAFQAVVTQDGGDPAPAPAPANPEVETLKAMLAAQNAQISALMGAVTQMQANQARQVPTPKQSQEEALPDSKDLDLDTINAGNTPVLTKQGWIVPPSFGTDPARLQQLKDEALQRTAMIKVLDKLSGD